MIGFLVNKLISVENIENSRFSIWEVLVLRSKYIFSENNISH